MVSSCLEWLLLIKHKLQCGPDLMLMIRSQGKWLSSYVCDVSFLSQAPQGSCQRRQPSVTRAAERATDGWSGRKASDKGPTELMMSRTAVKPASVEIVIASVFGQISLSLRLSLAPGHAGRERTAAHRQTWTIMCLATIWTCGGRDGGVLMQRETREQGQCFKIEWGLYLSSLWIWFQVNLYGVIILFLYSLSLAYI